VKKNMNDSAVQALRPLVRNNPGNASFRYHLGTALYQMGDKKNARVEFEAALSAQPGQADAQMIKEALARF
jgi:Flp pilus assembly protein TadD